MYRRSISSLTSFCAWYYLLSCVLKTIRQYSSRLGKVASFPELSSVIRKKNQHAYMTFTEEEILVALLLIPLVYVISHG